MHPTNDDLEPHFTEPYSVPASDFLTMLLELQIRAYERRPLPVEYVMDFAERLRKILVAAYPPEVAR